MKPKMRLLFQKMKYICMVQILIFCTPSSAATAEKPVIHWFHSDFPPIFIVRGPLKGQGYGDKTFEYFRERMTEFEHRVSVASLNRSFSNMQKEDGICEPALLKVPERDAFIHFSDRIYTVFTNQMITLKKHMPIFEPHLSHHGTIDLMGLLQRQDLTVGVVPQRVYSDKINSELEKEGAAPNRVHMPHDRYGQMLLRGRIHYAFGFPAEARLQFRLLGEPDAFVTLPIEGEANLVGGYIGCSDMPLGQRVIERVNAIIQEAGPVPAYNRFYEEWLDDNAIKTLKAHR